MRNARVEWHEAWSGDEASSSWVTPFLGGERADLVETALAGLPGLSIRDVTAEYLLGSTNAPTAYDWSCALDLGPCEPPATHAGLGGGGHPWRRVGLAHKKADADRPLRVGAPGLRLRCRGRIIPRALQSPRRVMIRPRRALTARRGRRMLRV